MKKRNAFESKNLSNEKTKNGIAPSPCFPRKNPKPFFQISTVVTTPSTS